MNCKIKKRLLISFLILFIFSCKSMKADLIPKEDFLVMMQKAKDEYQKLRYKNSINYYKAIMLNYPFELYPLENTEAYYNLALTYYNIRQREKARDIFEQIQTLDQEFVGDFVNLSKISLGRFKPKKLKKIKKKKVVNPIKQNSDKIEEKEKTETKQKIKRVQKQPVKKHSENKTQDTKEKKIDKSEKNDNLEDKAKENIQDKQAKDADENKETLNPKSKSEETKTPNTNTN